MEEANREAGAVSNVRLQEAAAAVGSALILGPEE